MEKLKIRKSKSRSICGRPAAAILLTAALALTAACASTDTSSLEAAVEANTAAIESLREWVDSEHAGIEDLVEDVRADEAAIAENEHAMRSLREYLDAEHEGIMDLVEDVRADEAVLAKLQELIEELTARIADLEGAG